MKGTFRSKDQFYIVECPHNLEDTIKAYVNEVENFVPILKDIFSLKPSYEFLTVKFEEKGPCYEAGGFIYLQSKMDIKYPENIYGGLFHETVHGFLEKYIHRNNGSNDFPEPCAIILQIAALDKINIEWANKFAEGTGSCEHDHPLLFELVRIYREYGFKPIRDIYFKMNLSDTPILFKETLICDLNKILRENSVENLINF